MTRSTGGHTLVIRGQRLRSRRGDLMDGGVRSGVRCRLRNGGPCGRVRSGRPCGRVSSGSPDVGIDVRRGSRAGVRRHRYDAAHRHNVPRGIANSQRATGCLRTADSQSNAEHARCTGCDQLG